jgi:membrane protease YdiL (CAAX protease family)
MTMYYERPQPKPYQELIQLMLYWVLSFFVAGFVTMLIWWGMTDKSIMSMQDEMLKPENLNAFKVIQVVSTVIIFFLPPYIIARRSSSRPFARLGFISGIKPNRLAISIAIMLCVLPLVGFLADLNEAIPISDSLRKMFEKMESDYLEQVKKIALFKTPADYIITLIVIAFFPALVEEVFFRGALQQIFMRWFVHPWLVIFITSLVFSAIHFSWYGFIPRITLGMMLGGIFYYTGNLWYSIAGHFFNNALMVTVLYVQHLQGKAVNPEVGNSAPWWAGGISLALIILLFRHLNKISATKVAEDSIANDDSSENNISA